MCKSKDRSYSSEELDKFITNLTEEYELKTIKLMEEKKQCMNDIREKETFIETLNKEKNNSSNLFSPNSKELNIENHYRDIDKIKINIENIKNDHRKLENIYLHLKEIKKKFFVQELPDMNMEHNILKLQEEERQRIGRDLHDSTVQSLTSLIHKSDLCSRLVDMDPVRTKLELNTMSNTLKDVIKEIREIIYNLKPMSLDDLGLVTTVERYINQLMINYDIKVEITHNHEVADILPVIKLSILRMIQEACNNAIKHAEAKNIDIDIRYSKKNIDLSIKDDGKGFDIDNIKDYDVTPEHSGYGLSIMKERVYLLSGRMKIKSIVNKGTTVTITVPIRKNEGEE